MSIARQIVSGLAGGVISKGVSNVANSLKSAIGRGIDGSPTANLGAKSSLGSTTYLQYPADVESDPMQGHYILFKINKITPSKIVRRTSTTMDAILQKQSKQLAGRQPAGATGPPGRNFAVVSAPKGSPTISGAAAKSSYAQAHADSVQAGAFIALYMPPNVSTTYTPNYTDVNVGGFAGALIATVDMVEAWLTGGDAAVHGKDAMSSIESMAKSAIMTSLNTIAPGAKALTQIRSGRIISNKMELSFEGVNRREFTYTFIFIPKSEKEAKIVEQIIWMFKYYASPEYASSNTREITSGPATGKVVSDGAELGRSMTIPDTFEIQYMYQGSENHFLNKISTCFCTSVQVQYGGDRYVAYTPTENVRGQRGAPPQRTTLTLTFKELELITKSRIDQGF